MGYDLILHERGWTFMAKGNDIWRQFEEERELQEYYDIVKDCTKGFDSIYEDYILELVGTDGLKMLKEYGCLETCGVINGRQLYVFTNNIKEDLHR